MRLNNKGEIIAETGFDGGSYTPKYASRTSVYLGDMSKEDIRVKKLVAQRNASVARQNAQAAAIEREKARSRISLQNKIKQHIANKEAVGNRMMELAKARGYEAARLSGQVPDFNKWIGNPMSGFGSAGETRINPDSAIDVEIVDANIPSVSEYGISNWMEDPENVVSRLESADNSYTKGKIVLEQLVDYAKSPDLSVVGMPVASAVSQAITNAGGITSAQPNPPMVAQPMQAQAQPDYVKYGLYALAAYIFLR